MKRGTKSQTPMYVTSQQSGTMESDVTILTRQQGINGI